MPRSMNNSNLSLVTVEPSSSTDLNILNEETFHHTVSLEHKRTERSGKPFLLMLLDMGNHSTSDQRFGLENALFALSLVLRETDVTGWYKEGSIVGAVLAEIVLDDQSSIPCTIMTRVAEALKKHLTPEHFLQINISFHCFPEIQTQEFLSLGAHSPMSPGVFAAVGSSL